MCYSGNENAHTFGNENENAFTNENGNEIRTGNENENGNENAFGNELGLQHGNELEMNSKLRGVTKMSKIIRESDRRQIKLRLRVNAPYIRSSQFLRSKYPQINSHRNPNTRHLGCLDTWSILNRFRGNTKINGKFYPKKYHIQSYKGEIQ